VLRASDVDGDVDEILYDGGHENDLSLV